MSFNKGFEQLTPKQAKKFRVQLAKELEISDQQVYNIKLGRSKMSAFQEQMVTWLFVEKFNITEIFDE